MICNPRVIEYSVYRFKYHGGQPQTKCKEHGLADEVRLGFDEGTAKRDATPKEPGSDPARS